MILQMMTTAGLGTSIALDLSSNSQPCRARSLQQASEALREHLLPHLGFSTLMALSRASSDWHQLISTATLTQLASHANLDLLPHGMSSHQPLREVLQERGSLLSRLRRQHEPGHSIGVDAKHDPTSMLHSHEQGMCILAWSPQPDISQPSQHILISRLQTFVTSASGCQAYERIASVLDVSTGRPVEFCAARSCIVPVKNAASGADASQDFLRQAEPGVGRHPNDMAQHCAGNDQQKLNEGQQEAQEQNLAQCTSIRHATLAAWTADARHVIITLSSPHSTGSLMLADTLLKSRLMLVPQDYEGFPPGAISPAGTMILSESTRPPDFDISLNLYQLPSLQHQFSMGPPDDHCRGLFERQQFAWSPDGSKLAVWWTCSPFTSSTRDYVTIHLADDGRCLTSTTILHGSQADDVRSTQDSDSSDNESYNSANGSDSSENDSDSSDHISDSSENGETGDEEQSLSVDNDYGFPAIQWDSASSYVLWTHKDAVACIRPAQGQVWQSSCWERHESSDQCVRTNVGTAASGHFLLVADHPDGFFTMLDALTGCVMSQWLVHRETKGIVWAAQSDVCLLPNHSLVLMPAAAACAALQNGYSKHSPSGMSTGLPVCKPEASDIIQLTQHSWHMFALAAPALPGSEGTSSPANFRGNETYTMHISPCGTVVVGVKNKNPGAVGGQPSGSKATFQHWHLTHVHKFPRTPLAGGNATLSVRPQECIGLVMPCQRTLHLAWHPQPRACTYACYDCQVGLRLVNAKSDCIVRSWTVLELAEYICEDSAMSARIESLEKKQSRVVPGSALAWSHNGCRLAVLVGKHCAVLHF